MSMGALAAKKQGNYWEMSTLLYENKPRTLEKMLTLVETANLDVEKFIQDFNSVEVKRELDAEVNNGIGLKIDATPTIYVNEEEVVGVKPYYELKKILEKHGAKRK